MASAALRSPPSALRALQAALLTFAAPLFLGGLLSDWAYFSTYEIQWINFAAWLVAGATLFAGLALIPALIELVRARRRRGQPVLGVLVLVVIFVLGLVNSFVHAKDAWATMPAGLALSAIVSVIAVMATWAGFAALLRGDAR